jgi:hypothetical protein
MTRRQRILAAVAAVAGLVLAPAAHADTPDQQFLNLVHANGIGGQDDTLINFAHEFCAGGLFYPSAGALLGQGIGQGQLYQVKVAASRVYCPNIIAVPAHPPNVYHGGNL